MHSFTFFSIKARLLLCHVSWGSTWTERADGSWLYKPCSQIQKQWGYWSSQFCLLATGISMANFWLAACFVTVTSCGVLSHEADLCIFLRWHLLAQAQSTQALFASQCAENLRCIANRQVGGVSAKLQHALKSTLQGILWQMLYCCLLWDYWSIFPGSFFSLSLSFLLFPLDGSCPCYNLSI